MKQLGVIDDDQVILLEADGYGPPTDPIRFGPVGNTNPDRRPLADYYRRSFGFESVLNLEDLITGPGNSIERYILMRTTVGTLLSKCSSRR